MAHMNKRQYSTLKDIRGKEYRSQKSDSRVFCRAANMRQKYFYSTEMKAKLAIKFSNGELARPYPCGTCMGWHTTSKTEKEYMDKKTAYKNYAGEM